LVLVLPGLLDYEIHHCAFSAAKSGQNPYDVEVLTSYLDPEKGYIRRGEFGFFYPPWSLLILAPLLSVPFKASAVLWLLTSSALIIGAAFLAINAQNGISARRSLVLACGAAFLFAPAIDALAFWPD